MPLPVPLWAYSITFNTSYKLRFFLLFFVILRHFLSVKDIYFVSFSSYYPFTCFTSYMFSRSSLVNCELVNLISDLELSRASLSCLF